MKKLILIDGHALVHRAFHALPPTLTSPKGVLTNAVYGFASLLIKMIKDINPDYIVATFDLAGPTLRHEEFAEYKIHRPKTAEELHAQVPVVKEILRAFGVPIYEKEGYEADDLIGVLSEKGKQYKGIQVIIMTGDLDTLQLVEDEKVVVFTLRRGLTDTIIYNEKEVNRRYGLKPNQLVDYKGLKGDPSDNIPGVSGIGDKTAATLIKEFGSLENLYEQISQSSKKKQLISEKLKEKLLANKDLAFFSKKLSTIIKSVDINFDLNMAQWRKNLKKQDLENLFKDLGFYSLLKRLPEINIGNRQLDQPPLIELKPSKVKVSDLEKEKDIWELFKKLKKTRSFSFYLSGPVISFSFDDKEVFCIELDSIVSKKDLWLDLESILEDEKIDKTCHDLKEMFKFFIQREVRLRGVKFDTKLAAYLLNSSLKDYALEIVYFNEFGENLDTNPRTRSAFLGILKSRLWERLKSAGLTWVFENIELPLAKVLAEMEIVGVKINLKVIQSLSKKTAKELKVFKEKIYELADTQFNINSPSQLSRILFEYLGLRGKVKKTGKGALSTAASELDKLSGEHEIVDLILKYRELQKLKTTYVDPFPNLIKKDIKRLCTTFNQTGTTTGRLSSQEPNLQNIPVRTELGQEFRKAFMADKGFFLISCDYSQLELRIVAHISQDKKMIEAFRRGEDIHTRTAAEIFSVPADKVKTSMRRTAKVLNFGLLYGMGLLGFQRASRVSHEQAREFIKKYMEEFSGVAKYMDDMRKKAHKDGYVTTIFGRRRQLGEINSGIREVARQAERMAINMPVQGTEADLIKLAMIKIYDLILQRHSSDAKLLLQVHDELLFEVKTNLVNEFSYEVKKIMENIYKLDVPLVVNVKYGDNWSEMKKIF